MKKLLASAALVAISATSLTACGASADSRARASIKASLIKDSANSTTLPKYDDKAAGCVADDIVGKIGVKQLQTYGLIDSKGNGKDADLSSVHLSSTDAGTFASALVDCNSAMLTKVQSTFTDEVHATGAQKTCIDKILNRDVAVKLFTGSFSGDDAAASSAITDHKAALAACMH